MTSMRNCLNPVGWEQSTGIGIGLWGYILVLPVLIKLYPLLSSPGTIDQLSSRSSKQELQLNEHIWYEHIHLRLDVRFCQK